jgi:CDP-glucose 4,6-dehydratase
MNKEFFRKKKVLVTGHTGFKGSWLTLMLSELEAEIVGISLDPKTSRDFYVVNRIDQLCDSHILDISDYQTIQKKINAFQPDLVFHLAACPLVRWSYANPLKTYQTNVMGTANILESIKNIQTKCAVVVVTTDKVYENKEWNYPYRESDRLGGKDPYSASKACVEMLVASYQHSFFDTRIFENHHKSIATARAGNVIGGGDWSSDRLIPDIIKAVENDIEVKIRNPGSIRPWQHVLEPLHGYLLLSENLYNDPVRYSGAWNFGPYPEDAFSVEEVVKASIDILEKGRYGIEEKINALHEANLLKLDISKSLNLLGWKPLLNTTDAIRWTVEWYKELQNNRNHIREYSKKSIHDYLNLIES